MWKADKKKGILSEYRKNNNFIDLKHFEKEISKPCLLFVPLWLSKLGEYMITFKLTVALAILWRVTATLFSYLIMTKQ